MPALLPAPKPLFSCSITRASRNFSRTSPGVPSVDALSTTTTSAPVPARLSSERWIQAAALWVTTIALTAASAIGFASDARRARAADALPREDRRARSRHQDRDHEKQEAGSERLVRADAEVPQEADEERLAHGEAVDRERNQHDQEEERAHHVVGPRREVDPDGLPAEPDGEDAHRLQRDRDQQDDDENADVVPVRVHRVVDTGDELVEPDEREDRPPELEQRPRAAREEQEAEEDRRHDEERFDPEVRAHVVVADGKGEADCRQDQRRRTSDRALEENCRGPGVPVARMTARRLVDANRVAADRGRQDLAGRVRHEVGTREPAQSVLDTLRAEQQLPAPGHREDRHDHQEERKQQVPRIRVADHAQRAAEVDLPDQVRGTEPGDEQRQSDADGAAAHRLNEACTRPSAATTSAMSSSECAGESGSERISPPARSATGSGSWSGRSLR